MTIAHTAMAEPVGLYPPTVVPPAKPLGMVPFLKRFVENPLKAIPIQAYTDPMVVLRQGGRVTAWITAPELTEQLLISRADEVVKTPIEARVFGATLGSGILIAEGREWRWQRRAMAPLFRPAEIATYVPAFTRAADGVLDRLRRAPAGTAHAIDTLMPDATFEIITATMLAGIEPAETSQMKAETSRFLDRVSWEVAYGVLGFPTWLWHPAKRQMRQAGQAMRRVVGRIVARHRTERGSSQTDGDLLARLIAARDPDTGAAMTDDRLIDNLLTLLEAGHETTAKALTWTLYLLARAPHWQQRLRDEVASVAGTEAINGRHIARLVLTQQVLKEAMRLYPPAPVLGRMPQAEFKLGGETFPAGAMLVVPVFALHRHRKLWVDPDRFDPTRFAPEREAGIARTQYMPFGGGPRVCIGGAFAMAEAAAVLATLVRGARFDWDGRHLPEPVSRVTLRPKGGMPLFVTVL